VDETVHKLHAKDNAGTFSIRQVHEEKLETRLWVQVLSVRQLALVMVHAYPYMPILEPFLDTLAANQGYPTNSDVASTAAPMVAEWRDFDVYSNHLHNTMFALKERSPYIPLSRHVAPRSEDRSAMPVSATPARHRFVLT